MHQEKPYCVRLCVCAGDVIVFVNGTCVLGYTHQDVVSLFQNISPSETVTLEICRGYPLPFDPDDPNTEIVTTVAVTLPQDGPVTETGPAYISQGPSMEFLNTSSRSLKSLPDLTRSANINSNTSSQNSVAGEHKMMGHGNGPPDLVSHPGAPSKAEELHISIVRGPMGFGFTIADSPYGQKVYIISLSISYRVSKHSLCQMAVISRRRDENII